MTINYLDSKRLQGLSTDGIDKGWNLTTSTTFVTVGASHSLPSTGTFTWSIWWKPLSSHTQSDQLFLERLASQANDYMPRIRINAGKLKVTSSTSEVGYGGVVETTNSVNTNQWNHILVKQSGNNITGILNNGTPVTTSVISGNNSGENWRFFYSGSNINSAISNTIMYSTALSSGDITTLYNNGIPISSTNSGVTSNVLIEHSFITTPNSLPNTGSLGGSGNVITGTPTLHKEKPTNVRTNSIFEQTDTNTRHWYNGTNWITQPTFEDDFSSYTNQTDADTAWVTNNTSKVRVNITNDNLDYIFNAGDTFLSISKDLTTVSNSAWICRFKLRFSTLTAGNVNAPFMYCGLSSTVNSTEASTVNRIYMMLKYDSDDQKFGGLDTFGTNTYSTFENDGDNPQAFSPVINTDYFFEITRTLNTTYTVKRYSDSSYSTVSQTSSGTCDAGVTSLRYFNISTHAGGTAGNITGTLDDFKFYNGVTSV